MKLAAATSSVLAKLLFAADPVHATVTRGVETKAVPNVTVTVPVPSVVPRPHWIMIEAAPLLIGAYAFALVALFGYVISVSRRLTAVKTDIARLESDVKRSSRG